VRVTGLDPAKESNHSKILSRIGYVPQLELQNLYYEISALGNIEIFANTYGLKKNEAYKIAEELFTILDIPEDTWHNALKKMSGGEKKRVSMAIGLIHEPEVLFLDEPTTGVDANKRYDILNYLKVLNRKLNTTMFIITHDLEASLVCDRAAILREGKVLEFESPQNLIQSLPSGGLLVRFTIKRLDEEKIEIIKDFPYTEEVVRAGNLEVEIFLDDLEAHLPLLLSYLIENNIEVTSMTKDIANFRRFFQIRIDEEEEKEKQNKIIK
jgi:ABC-2 type transport system ATP-binding protein